MNKVTGREMVRHALHVTTLDRLLIRRRSRRGFVVGHLFEASRSKVFDHVYRQGAWLIGASDGSRSGLGSEMAATSAIRNELPHVLASLAARSLVDVGCGDFTWMQHMDLDGIDYTGVDIVPSIIDANQKIYGSAKRRFLCIDAVSDGIPFADVVLCREVLFHLSFADGRDLLDGVRRSGAKYLVATSDTATGFNSNIRTGDYRVLNLMKRPYSFSAPINWLPDDSIMSGRGLGVWPISAL